MFSAPLPLTEEALSRIWQVETKNEGSFSQFCGLSLTRVLLTLKTLSFCEFFT